MTAVNRPSLGYCKERNRRSDEVPSFDVSMMCWVSPPENELTSTTAAVTAKESNAPDVLSRELIPAPMRRAAIITTKLLNRIEDGRHHSAKT
jgi:hypothetical protein